VNQLKFRSPNTYVVLKVQKDHNIILSTRHILLFL